MADGLSVLPSMAAMLNRPAPDQDGAEQSLIDRIHSAIAAAGDQPITVAQLARELGVKKQAVRAAVEEAAHSGATVGGTKLRMAGGRRVLERVEPVPPKGSGSGRSASPGKSGRKSTPPDSGASGGHGKAPSGDGSGAKAGTGGGPGAAAPKGVAARASSGSKARVRKYDGARPGRSPPERPVSDTTPKTRKENKNKLAEAGKKVVAAAKAELKEVKEHKKKLTEAGKKVAAAKTDLKKAEKKLADAERARKERVEQLQREAERASDGARRRELLDARDARARHDKTVEEAKGAAAREKDRVEEAKHELTKQRQLGQHRRELRKVKEAWADVDSARRKYDNGEKLSRYQYFALVAEQIWLRDRKIVHDEQLLGAMLADRGVRGRPRGVVLEMATGEGKTYTGMLVALKRALENKAKGTNSGVHVMTSNPKLAARDARNYRDIANALGLEVRVLRGQGKSLAARRRAYEADVTFGSEPVRLRLAHRPASGRRRRVQRKHSLALVDEADMVLLDWGSTPYVLAEAAAFTARRGEVLWARDVARGLRSNEFSTGWFGVRIGKAQARRISERLGTKLTDQQVTDLVNAKNAGGKRLDVDYMIAGRSVVQILDNRTVGPAWAALEQGPARGSRGQARSADPAAARDLRPDHDGAVPAQLLRGRRHDRHGVVRRGAASVPRVYGLKVVGLPSHYPSKLKVRDRQVYATDEARLEALAGRRRRSTDEPGAGAADLPHPGRGRGVRRDVEGPRDSRQRPERAGTPDLLRGRGGGGRRPAACGDRGQQHHGSGHRHRTRCRQGGGRDSIEAHGGLRVTVASVFESRRATRQAFGRAARQGAPGSAGEVLTLTDPILIGHTSPRALAKLKKKADRNGLVPAKAANKLVDRAVKKAEKAAKRQLEASSGAGSPRRRRSSRPRTGCPRREPGRGARGPPRSRPRWNAPSRGSRCCATGSPPRGRGSPCRRPGTPRGGGPARCSRRAPTCALSRRRWLRPSRTTASSPGRPVP